MNNLESVGIKSFFLFRALLTYLKRKYASCGVEGVSSWLSQN